MLRWDKHCLCCFGRYMNLADVSIISTLWASIPLKNGHINPTGLPWRWNKIICMDVLYPGPSQWAFNKCELFFLPTFLFFSLLLAPQKQTNGHKNPKLLFILCSLSPHNWRCSKKKMNDSLMECCGWDSGHLGYWLHQHLIHLNSPLLWFHDKLLIRICHFIFKGFSYG